MILKPTINNSAMLGVLLCGGLSTRMESDKGLMHFQQNTWAEAAAKLFTQLDLPFIISVNSKQVKNYTSIFSADKLLTDNPILQINGPLCGVLSAHIKYPNHNLLVLACDMPLMQKDLLQILLNQYQTNAAFGAYYFLNNGQPEPLCAIYKANALSTIYQLYQDKKLLKHSMKFVLEQISSAAITLDKDQVEYFKNFNARKDLNGLDPN
ncbi:MAG: molybdenum cofactor guanylyltransferase [Sphingobacteriia bacterium]|nr:MAG: molybdenum cofactor guanylyltransferase [Sphingobacteriia bacterium]